MPVTENPLLFGTYVLMLQQDRLSDPNVKKIAPLSITPIVPSDMRFDRYSNRLQKVYNYQDHWAADPGKGPIGWKSISTSENGGAATTTDLSKVNSAGATDIRGKELGYTTPTLGEYEVFPTDVKALKVALLEACRSAPVTKADDGQFSGCANYQLSEGEYGFEYPVTQYPEAFTLLAQYPLHTHLVFSVERTEGGTETPYHEGFRTFSEYVQEQISEARSNTDLSDFSELFGKAVIDFRKQNGVLARLGTFPDKEKMERVCLLWEEGLHGTEPERTSLVSKAPVYNELFHVTERIMTEPDEVARFIASSGCTKGGSDEQKCSCEDAVAKRIAAADAPVPAIGSRKLVLTVPLLTGGDVSAVQKALGDKGFPVTGEDGTYGSATETQVKAFQMVQGLTVDGEVGTATFTALGLL